MIYAKYAAAWLVFNVFTSALWAVLGIHPVIAMLLGMISGSVSAAYIMVLMIRR